MDVPIRNNSTTTTTTATKNIQLSRTNTMQSVTSKNRKIVEKYNRDWDEKVLKRLSSISSDIKQLISKKVPKKKILSNVENDESLKKKNTMIKKYIEQIDSVIEQGKTIIDQQNTCIEYLLQTVVNLHRRCEVKGGGGFTQQPLDSPCFSQPFLYHRDPIVAGSLKDTPFLDKNMI